MTGTHHRFAARRARPNRLVSRGAAEDAHDDNIQRMRGDTLGCADLASGQGHRAHVLDIESSLILHVYVARVPEITSHGYDENVT